MYVRKERAGSSSHGHVWKEDGAVIEVPDADGAQLLAIRDGGFAAVAAPEPVEDEDPDGDDPDDEGGETPPDPDGTGDIHPPAPANPDPAVPEPAAPPAAETKARGRAKPKPDAA